MKKLDNFINCLAVLANADFKMAETNDIYRTGIIGQFNLTFELAWKALQEILKIHGVDGSSTGSPREILQLGYKTGFLKDSGFKLPPLNFKGAKFRFYPFLIKVILFRLKKDFYSSLFELEFRPLKSRSTQVDS